MTFVSDFIDIKNFRIDVIKDIITLLNCALLENGPMHNGLSISERPANVKKVKRAIIAAIYQI